MKKIYSIFLAALALLVIVPFALADGELQVGPDYEDNGSGICYKKSVSSPNPQGVYTITLESFATGEGVKIQKGIAADIVLVLDISNSMNYSMGNTYSGTTKEWTYNNRGNSTLYILYNDTYCQINIDHSYWGSRVSFTYNNGTYYLTANGVTTTSPSRVADNATFYNGTLYTATPSGSRLAALKTAVNSFIDLIDENDKDFAPAGQERLGNKIAIVTFAEDADDVSGGLVSLDQKTALKQTVSNLTVDGGTMANKGMLAAYNILSDEEQSQNNLKTVVFFTDGDPGMYAAWDNTYDRYNSRVTSSSYYIDYNEYYYQNTWKVANQTISYANDIKNLAEDHGNPELDIITKVFTVSIIPEEDVSDYTRVYLGKTSSNWLNATNMGSTPTDASIPGWNSTDIWANGNGTNTGETKYTLSATTASGLQEAFEEVAGDTGGSTLPMTEESVSKVDVVSASFMLPPNTNPDDIEIFVAKCNGRQEKSYKDEETGETKTGVFYQFDTPVAKANCTDTYDKPVFDDEGHQTGTVETPVAANIKVELKASGTYPGDATKLDMIEVTKFDYGNLYVGPVYKDYVTDPSTATEEDIAYYHGYKLIVKIPIKMDTHAVGGPNVDTNGPGSGIIVNGTPVVRFKSPQVSLPINLHINKQGLNVGESAKFIIQSAVLPDAWKAEDFDYPDDSTDPRYNSLTWTDVSTVLVTRHEGQDDEDPITRVMGMPSVNEAGKELIYRIVEDDWSWSYNPGTTLISTSDQLITNPFVFYNTKQTMIDATVRHAESKAMNTFKTGDFIQDDIHQKVNTTEHVFYDDSKDNGR